MENIKNEFMLARLAMAIDCEGSIMVIKYSNKGNEPKYSVEVALYNTNENFINWLVDSFGFHKVKVNRKDRPYHKTGIGCEELKRGNYEKSKSCANSNLHHVCWWLR